MTPANDPQLPLALAATTTGGNKIYYQDDTLLIRQYRDSDLAGVQQVFRNGMQSNIPLALQQFTQKSPFFGISSLGAASVVHYLVRGVCDKILGPWLLMGRPSLSLSSKESRGNSGGTTLGSNGGISWWLAWTGSLATIALNYVSLRKGLAAGFGGYIERSIQDDLSQIPSVYLTGQGNFLVAVDRQSQDIIGCIAGEDKNDNDDTTKSNKTKDDMELPTMPQFEIRRMAVSTEHRRKKLAQKLVAALERDLQEKMMTQQKQQQQASPTTTNRNKMLIFLTCSSVQIPAHKLYASCGYTRTKVFTPSGVPLMMQLYGFRVLRYERTLELGRPNVK